MLGLRREYIKKVSFWVRDANVFYALAFLAPIFGAIGPLQMWILVLAAGSALLLRKIAVHGLDIGRVSSVTAIFVGFLLWSFLSSFWAIDPRHSIEITGRLLVLGVALFTLLSSARSLTLGERREFMKWLSYGAVIAAFLVLLGIAYIAGHAVWIQNEQMAEHKLSIFNRTASIIVIFVWVVGVSLSVHFGKSAGIAFFIVSAVTVVLLAPATPILALLIGGLVFGLAYFSPVLGKIALALGFLLSILSVLVIGDLAPLAIEFFAENVWLPHTSVHRIVIWDFTAENIMQRPLIGWGLDAARSLPGGDDKIFLFANLHGIPTMGAALPLHTHNALMQIWLELGLIGVGFSTTLFCWILYVIPVGRENRRSAAMMATLATAFIIAQLSFGIWQGWWLGTLSCATVLVAVMGEWSAADSSGTTNVANG